ncbi:hypothetical protein ACFYO0_40840 [Streptomyces sp. NPDC006365]
MGPLGLPDQVSQPTLLAVQPQGVQLRRLGPGVFAKSVDQRLGQ